MQSFHYHRSIAPGLGVLLALAIIEALVVHLVAVALCGLKVAIILSVLDLSVVLAIVAVVRALRHYPVTLGEGLLVMRLGKLKVLIIPIDQIAGLREHWDGATLKEPGVRNFALVTWPNVVVDLSPPLKAGRRTVSVVAHRLDDAPAFRKALREVVDDPERLRTLSGLERLA